MYIIHIQKITSVDASVLLQLQVLQRKAADKNALQNHKSIKSVLPSLWFYHGIGILLRCCRGLFLVRGLTPSPQNTILLGTPDRGKNMIGLVLSNPDSSPCKNWFESLYEYVSSQLLIKTSISHSYGMFCKASCIKNSNQRRQSLAKG